MTAEILAATEHLVLRRMTNDDAAALAAYRSDPVQARYQSWETPYPLDCLAPGLVGALINPRQAPSRPAGAPSRRPVLRDRCVEPD
jgi:RimJ/RimL family protein N-acetyltransferase